MAVAVCIPLRLSTLGCKVNSIVSKQTSRDGVHASTFFFIRQSDHRIIGSIQLRHSLTPELEQHGGHIGYAIRPSERGKGYGSAQLLLVLEEAKALWIPRVMIFRDQTNTASKKTIQSCGGVLARVDEYQGIPQAIYWINLSQKSL